MPAVIPVVGAVAGGLIANHGARGAARSAEESAAAQIAEGRRQYDQTRSDNEPFRQAGVGATGAQQNLLGIGADPRAQDAAFARWRDSTGYQFGLDESLRSVQQGAASRGGLFSGAAMKALQDRGSQVANQGFGTYFNQIGAVAGQGQAANNSNAQAGQAYASNFGNATMAAGNARASAYQQRAGAWGDTLNQLGGAYGYYGGGGNTGVPAQGSGTGFYPTYASGGPNTFWGHS